MENTERKLAAALSRLQKLEKRDSFDPTIKGSSPTKGQLEFLKEIGKYKHRVIRAGNRSGKGATIAREVAWILADNHPWWARPAAWEGQPILVLVVGQDRKMMEVEIWDKKIAPFLNLSEWRRVRVGGSLQFVENRTNGDKIVFLSHADSSDKNRKHIQGYTAHYVWLDEMPATATILQEIRARAMTNGYFVASFTPKFRSEEVRSAIDSISAPLGKIYRLGMLDNPAFKDRQDEVLSELNGYSEGYRNSVLYGDWYTGDSAVYEWNPATMEEEPGKFNYSTAWRHVLAVDPALKSKLGFTLWAECPSTGVWFLMKDEYIDGIYDPEAMFQAVEERVKGYNICRRVSDIASWFLGIASRHGIPYMYPYKKTERKPDLIKNLQAALSSGKIKISPWCTTFKDEIQSCQWSETSDKIVNSSIYHTLDSAQYFVDCMPKYELNTFGMTWHEELRRGNQKRKQAEATAKKVSKKGRVKSISAWSNRGKKFKIC